MHRYPELMIAPMRREIADMGAVDLKTPEAVDTFVEQSGTAMIVVNSVCGCSAGTMRPGLGQALERGPKPDAIGQVFAGADIEATERARELFAPYPPSSPAIALFKDGKLVFMLERHQIQGRPPEVIAGALTDAIESHSAAV